MGLISQFRARLAGSGESYESAQKGFGKYGGNHSRGSGVAAVEQQEVRGVGKAVHGAIQTRSESQIERLRKPYEPMDTDERKFYGPKQFGTYGLNLQQDRGFHNLSGRIDWNKKPARNWFE